MNDRIKAMEVFTKAVRERSNTLEILELLVKGTKVAKIHEITGTKEQTIRNLKSKYKVELEEVIGG